MYYRDELFNPLTPVLFWYLFLELRNKHQK